jgi:hypothetical protein
MWSFTYSLRQWLPTTSTGEDVSAVQTDSGRR